MSDIDIPDEEVPIQKASSRRNIKYVCGQCGRDVGRENLRVKKVMFCAMGENAKVIRTRVVEWLCVVTADDGGPSCLEKDPTWTRPKHTVAPGLADTKIAQR